MREIKVMDAFDFEGELRNSPTMFQDFVCEDLLEHLEHVESDDRAMTAIFEANSGDPDYLRCEVDGEVINLGFFDYDFEGIKYVVIQFDGDQLEHVESVYKMLELFFTDNYKEYFTKSDSLRTWDDFSEIDMGIAYRGGCGYSYNLWSYINNKQL